MLSFGCGFFVGFSFYLVGLIMSGFLGVVRDNDNGFYSWCLLSEGWVFRYWVRIWSREEYLIRYRGDVNVFVRSLMGFEFSVYLVMY